MSNFKIFDSRAGAYVGPAGERTTFATQVEAFRHIFDVLAPIANDGSADDNLLDVHDIERNIAYHRWMIETDYCISVKTTRTRIDPNRRMVIEAIKVWSHNESGYMFEPGGDDDEDRDLEFESLEEANRYIDRNCAHPMRKRKEYEARWSCEYV
jgi:hypothetical protein